MPRKEQKLVSEQDREDFEAWVIDIDNALDRGLAELPAALQGKLDYSEKSLDELEQYILESYLAFEDILKEDQAEKLNFLAVYIGETYRKALGHYWELSDKHADNAYYGLPILTDGTEVECPLTLVTASVDRRRGNYLRTVLENMQEEAGK